MMPSWATFADSAFSRCWNVCRSCRSQIVRTPAGETESARFFSSLATRGATVHQLADRSLQGFNSLLHCVLMAATLDQQQALGRLRGGVEAFAHLEGDFAIRASVHQHDRRFEPADLEKYIEMLVQKQVHWNPPVFAASHIGHRSERGIEQDSECGPPPQPEFHRYGGA